MIVGIGKIELSIPHARSLKEKRRVVKSLSGKIGHRFNVSVSEIDNHELWQLATIGIAHVSNTRTEVEKLLTSVTNYAQGITDGEIVRSTYAYYDPDKD